MSLGFPMFPSRHRQRGRGWGERPRPSIAPAPGGGRAQRAGSGPPSAGCRLPWGPRRSSGLAWCPWSAGSVGEGRARGQLHPQVCFFLGEEAIFAHGSVRNAVTGMRSPRHPLPRFPPVPNLPLSSTGSALWTCLASVRAPGGEEGGRLRAGSCARGCTPGLGSPGSLPAPWFCNQK